MFGRSLHNKMREGLLEIASIASVQEAALNTHKFYTEVLDNLPIMAWAKDLEGNFIITNKSVRENLLLVDSNEEAIGKNGAYFADRARLEDEYTFGEVCDDSDRVTVQRYLDGDTDYPFCFLEWGRVQGKFLALEVYKSPNFNQQGELIGTVGAGIDVTEKVILYHKIIEDMSLSRCGGNDPSCLGIKRIAQDYFTKYHFTGSESVRISQRNSINLDPRT